MPAVKVPMSVAEGGVYLKPEMGVNVSFLTKDGGTAALPEADKKTITR